MSSLAPSREVDLDHPVFIIGVGRSGTSLLQSMLDAHPDLAFTPETHFFRRYVARADVRARIQDAGPQAFGKILAEDRDFARAGLPFEALQGERDDLDLLATFRALLERCALDQGKHRVGDKDPRNIDHLAALARSFPGAKVLHVIRDPRDVLLSRTKAAWSATRPWWSHPLIYREQLRRGRARGAELFGESYHELRYEALISDAEATLREVCDHLELAWSATMLEFGPSAARLVDASEMSWKKETLGPLLTSNAGKWREGLTEVQVRYTEEICAEAFEELGYERAEDGSSWVGVIAPLLRTAAALAYDWKLGGAR